MIEKAPIIPIETNNVSLKVAMEGILETQRDADHRYYTQKIVELALSKHNKSHNNYIAEMQSYLGYPDKIQQDPIPNPAKEAMFIKKMINRGFSWEDILEFWKVRVAQRGEFVSMTWINEDIGKKVSNGKNQQHTTKSKGYSVEELRSGSGVGQYGDRVV